MKAKEVTIEQFAMEMGKFMEHAKRGPVVVRPRKGPALLIRAMDDDDVIDELITSNPRFKASIRKARRNMRQGKGIPLAEARRMLNA